MGLGLDLEMLQVGHCLEMIEKFDKPEGYKLRNAYIFQLLGWAARFSWKCGIRADSEDGPTWPVVFVELPDYGQVSWHVPQHELIWDGHTNEQKYERARAFTKKIYGQ